MKFVRLNGRLYNTNPAGPIPCPICEGKGTVVYYPIKDIKLELIPPKRGMVYVGRPRFRRVPVLDLTRPGPATTCMMCMGAKTFPDKNALRVAKQDYVAECRANRD